VAWMESVARECLRVLKPGGHALVWAIPRTSHWTGMAWEDAGFECRDKIYHCFGSGFPKSLNLGNGWGTALKPAVEEWWLLRKPISEANIAANVLRWGTGGLHIDGCRVDVSASDVNHRTNPSKGNNGANSIFGVGGRNRNLKLQSGRFPAHLIYDGSEEVVGLFPETGNNWRSDKGNKRKGWHDVAYGTGGPRGVSDSGSAARFFKACPDDDPEDAETRRLVYQAKASKADRDEGLEEFEAIHRPNGNKWTDQDYRVTKGERPPSAESGPRRNHHPTVKSTNLMRYLCRLITPPGGIVLDPFMGSGSTGKGAALEGFQFIGIEQDAEYLEIARARIAAAVARSEALSLEQRVAWLETQVQAQGAKLRKIEAQHQQMSLFG
jgi:site-specific DNA-methyltransferase (adenine-specific)